jgi:hypothetical protein
VIAQSRVFFIGQEVSGERAEDRRSDLNSRGGRMKRYAVSPRPNDLPRTALLAGEFMHPAQFRDVWSGDSHSPECELAAAVLDAAVIDLQKYRYARGRYRQRIYWQAYQWVASGDRQWPFSFVVSASSCASRPRRCGHDC